jgi:uncharacterized protein (TIGR03083 family)
MATTRDTVIDAIRASHARLASALDRDDLAGAFAERQSYCADWTIGQVLSHLGSGAEIFTAFLAAGDAGRPAPETAELQPVWDRWNALAPAEQIRSGLESDRRLLAAIDAMTEGAQDAWRLHFFGAERDLEGLVRMRLSELVLHSWDVAVALDPTAVLDRHATGLVLDQLPWIVGFAGKPAGTPTTVRFVASDLGRTFGLEVGTESVSLSELASDDSPGDVAGTLSAPGEAIVRLVYGRLDPDHTPALDITDGLDLDFLRGRFPGI